MVVAVAVAVVVMVVVALFATAFEDKLHRTHKRSHKFECKQTNRQTDKHKSKQFRECSCVFVTVPMGECGVCAQVTVDGATRRMSNMCSCQLLLLRQVI